MIKALKKEKFKTWYFVDDIKLEGVPSDVTGNLSGVWGNLSDVRGNLSDVRGSLSGVTGDLSGVTGDLSGVWGNLSDCDISDSDRVTGIDIDDLIG